MSLFRQEVFEAQRKKLHGDVILVQPLSLKLIALMAVIIGSILLTFAGTREYTRKETARGFIVPETGTTSVRATRGGELLDLMVFEGQIVEVGTPLFESRVDVETSEGFVSERRLDSLNERLFQIDLRETEMKTRFKGEELRLRSLISGLEAEVEAMGRRIELQGEVSQITNERLEKFRKLLQDEVISQVEFDSLQRQSLDAMLALESLKQQKISSESTLRNSKFELGGLPTQSREEEIRLAAERAQLKEVLASIDADTTYIVRAPVSGVISSVSARPGEQLNPNRPIITLIPSDSPLCLLYTSPSPRDLSTSRMPSSA